MYTYKRVALIGVDGAGNFFRQADTPNIDRIFADGSVAYDVYTSSPSISAECWGSMLHGVTPDLHRLTNGIVGSVPYDTKSLFPSVFRTIRENDADCELASFCNWNPINVGIIEQDLGVHEDTAGDAALCDKICAYLEEQGVSHLPIIFSEFGGGALYGFHDAECPKWSEEYQAKLLDYTLNLFHEHPAVRGSFIWQFCDIRTCAEMGFSRARGFNNKGKNNENRRPKAAYYTVQKCYRAFAEEESK